jgi:uncharacterized membrane protein
MTTWVLVRWLHLLAMAFFVGGQLVLVAAVVPALRADAHRPQLRAVARRFGWGSLVALVLLLATGSAMAGYYRDWGRGTLHVKLALVALAGVLILVHLRRPQHRWIDGLVFLVSLAIVWLGIALAH